MTTTSDEKKDIKEKLKSQREKILSDARKIQNGLMFKENRNRNIR